MDQYVSNISGKTGIDIPTIIAIIEAILSAIQPIITKICPPAPVPVPAKEIFAKADTSWGQFAIMRGLRSCGFGLFHPKHAVLRRAITDEAQAVSEDDADMMLAAAK